MRSVGGSFGRSAAFPSFIRLYLFCADPLQSEPLHSRRRKSERRRRKRIFDEELGEGGGRTDGRSGEKEGEGNGELSGCKMCGTCLSVSVSRCMRALSLAGIQMEYNCKI